MFGAPRGGEASAPPGRPMRASTSRTVGRAKPGGTRARSGPGGARVHLGPAEEGKNGRAKARSGPDEAGPAEQKRAPGRQIRTAPRPSGLFHAADQPQGVSAAESPRRRRRTRRSGTPRGPAPSGRGSRRRWPRCRVRPAGRRFGRRFRPDCAAAAARRPAA